MKTIDTDPYEFPAIKRAFGKPYTSEISMSEDMYSIVLHSDHKLHLGWFDELAAFQVSVEYENDITHVVVFGAIEDALAWMSGKANELVNKNTFILPSDLLRFVLIERDHGNEMIKCEYESQEFSELAINSEVYWGAIPPGAFGHG